MDLKKLKEDLDAGRKTEFADKFKTILEQADNVDISKTQKKVEDIDFVALGLTGTDEDVEKGKVEHAKFMKEITLDDEKEMAKAQILLLQQDVVNMKLAIMENEKMIRTLSEDYAKKYNESVD